MDTLPPEAGPVPPAPSRPGGAGDAPPKRRDPGLLVDGLLLALLAVLVCLPVKAFVHRWLAIPAADGATHALNVMTFQAQLLRGDGLMERLLPLLAWTDPRAYPPMTYAVPGGLGALAGGLDLAGLASLQALWVLVAMGAVYVLGRRVFASPPGGPDPGRGRRVGLLAAFLVASIQPMVVYLPDFIIDLPGTAMILVALATLAGSRDMDRTGPALAAGAGLAGALLTKWTTLVYLAPALAWVGYRVVRARTGRERGLMLLHLGLLAGALGAAWWLAGVFPANQDPMQSWVPFPTILTWTAGLGAGAAVLFAAAWFRVPPGPARNLVLAVLVTSTLVAPYLVWNRHSLGRRVELHETVELRDPWAGGQGHLRVPLGHTRNLGELAPLVVGAAFIWLLVCGPRGSFFLVGAPVLSGALGHLALNLIDFRYYLPMIPLEILAVVGWLQGDRLTRAVSLAAFLALGSWNLALWSTGLTRAIAPGHEPTRVRLGAGPEALNGRLRRLADAAVLEVGTGPRLLWTWSRTPQFSPEALQIASLDRGHGLVIRGFGTGPAGTQPQTATLAAYRFLLLLEPGQSRASLRELANQAIERLPEAWALVVGPSDLARQLPNLPGRLEPPRPLPAPAAGLEAWLYRFHPTPVPDIPHGGAPTPFQGN